MEHFYEGPRTVERETSITALIEELANRPAWMADALCKEYPHLSWVPERGEDTTEQRRVCSRCLCSTECLDYALQRADRVGVFAGTSQRERRLLRVSRRAA